MKQDLVIFGCLLAGLGGYKLFMEEDGSPTQTTPTGRAPQGGATAQQPQRPSLGENARNNRGRGPARPQALPSNPTPAQASWEGTTTEATLVRMEDAWGLDTSAVDWDAPVLMRVNGVDITQEDFQRQCTMLYSYAGVRARLFRYMGEHMAERYGHEIGLDDETWEEYVEAWCAHQGLSREEANLRWSISLKLPVASVERARRDFIEGILACYPPTESVEDLPSEVRDMVGDQSALANIFQLQAYLGELRSGNVEGGLSVAERLVNLELPLTLMMQGVGGNVLFQRSWTSFDSPLPEGQVAAFMAGDVPVDQVLPPWEYEGGEVAYVPTSELYQPLRAIMSREQMEDALRHEVWAKVLRAELEQKGEYPPDREVWVGYARESLAGQMAALSASFIRVEAEGYPTMAHYRRSLALQAGFRASQPVDWDSDAVMREFFTNHRFFVQRWQPDVQIALFPAATLNPENWNEVDWDGALAAAESFRTRVTEGGEDFKAVLDEHNAALTESYRAVLGDAGAQGFAQEFGVGRFSVPRPQVERLLKEPISKQLMNAASVVRNAVVRLDRGEISPPWRSPLGYVVLRMNNARLSGLEDIYDDLEPATREEFYNTHFRLWVNEVLANASIEQP